MMPFFGGNKGLGPPALRGNYVREDRGKHMRLVTFVDKGDTRIGVLRQPDHGDDIVDVQRVAPSLPREMNGLLAAGQGVLAELQRAVESAPASASIALGSVRLKAPVPMPSKIIGIGLNYREHVLESKENTPEHPTVFAKFPNCLIGPGESIVLPRASTSVDYEGELAVVIGRRARNVSEADALDYVGGYAPFNDVSARDFQHHTSQWTIGKTFDTFGPMGPALVTADEIPNPQALMLRLSIDGEVLQEASTDLMIFSVAFLVAHLSTVMTLEPGDIIATGTPGGVGGSRQPPRYLRAGETVRVEIEGLGVLESPVVAER
jgi:acylpyruvate hydrolase